MAQVTTTSCDCGCGWTWTSDQPLPECWWVLSDESRVMRTGPLHFSSLACLERWVNDPRVKKRYAEDWKTS